MKHKIADDVNVNVNVNFDAQDVADTIDKIQMAMVTVIVVSTIAHIFKKAMG